MFPIWDVILYPIISCDVSCMISNDDVVWSNLIMRWSTCCAGPAEMVRQVGTTFWWVHMGYDVEILK